MSSEQCNIKNNFFEILPNCFDIKMILLQMSGLILSGIIVTLFSTIASKIEIIQIFINTIGNMLAYIPVIVAMTASTLIFLFKNQQNESISISRSLSLVKDRMYPMTVAIVEIFGVVFLLYLLIIISNIFVKIPYLGELLWPIFYIPNFLLAICVMLLILALIFVIHFLPASILVFPEDHIIFRRIFNILKVNYREWASFFFVSAISGVFIMGTHYFATILHNEYSKYILDEKFYKLLSSIPSYPGYLLKPWTVQFLPFDYVCDPTFTLKLGAFFWAIMMYLVICFFTAIVFNIWNCVGGYYILSKQPSSL